MNVVSEDRQRVEFDATWSVCKWDFAAEFDGSMGAALHQLPRDGVKAADIVGARNSADGTILVAELKDFTNPNIPPAHLAAAAEKAESKELAGDIVRKVIDTLAGATFSHDVRDRRCRELANWRSTLARSRTKILVLVFIEVAKPAVLTMLSADLQARLRWLGPNSSVFVTGSPFDAAGLAYRI